MSDPRLSVVRRRFSQVARILVFASGKGGVGKSSCSTAAALLLARGGYKTGLLDLDFHGATDHIILGLEPHLPGEEGGILPIEGPHGLRFMGIAPFTGNRAVALRGEAVSNAILELLAVVMWGELDVLVVDMPPGIGEAILDFQRWVEGIEVVLVSTPSILSRQVMGRLYEVLLSGGVNTGGYLLNMDRGDGARAPAAAGSRNEGPKTLLGRIPYLDELEYEIGSAERILSGRFAHALSGALGRLSFELPLQRS